MAHMPAPMTAPKTSPMKAPMTSPMKAPRSFPRSAPRTAPSSKVRPVLPRPEEEEEDEDEEAELWFPDCNDEEDKKGGGPLHPSLPHCPPIRGTPQRPHGYGGSLGFKLNGVPVEPQGGPADLLLVHTGGPCGFTSLLVSPPPLLFPSSFYPLSTAPPTRAHAHHHRRAVWGGRKEGAERLSGPRVRPPGWGRSSGKPLVPNWPPSSFQKDPVFKGRRPAPQTSPLFPLRVSLPPRQEAEGLHVCLQ
ncbi:uncharacterized protein LOC115535469 isoform X2 [Gadus morhua]|uniref:uncharacterized protein LOC115535469 isoform X2 n=1 Tax=Gadus morhua TaxID=8049 RepID=UPI0011B82196|nr:uncharacterized protein LOC115535469 isoform X2 [Gadus morhua]